MRTKNSVTPLVSVIVAVKNMAWCVKRCMDSLLNQQYKYIEIVVQDGASTDGTLDILLSYGDSIKLESKNDSSGDEAFLRCVERITGEIVCWCGADDEFLPDSVLRAVNHFNKYPKVDIIYGDAYRIDKDGNVTDILKFRSWNYKRYFCDEFHILLSSSYFRSNCLKGNKFVGDEFGIFAKLGLQYLIQYIPQILSKFASYPGNNSSNIDNVVFRGSERLKLVNHICDKQDTPKEIQSLRLKAITMILLNQMKQCVNLGHNDLAKEYLEEAISIKPNLPELRSNFINQAKATTANKKIFLYGAGEHTSLLLETIDFQQNNTEILGIIESEPLKWGKNFQDVMVYSPEILINQKETVLLSSFVGQESMSEQVKSHNCPTIELYDLDDYQNTIDFVFLYHLNLSSRCNSSEPTKEKLE